jgi:hypothetical protein
VPQSQDWSKIVFQGMVDPKENWEAIMHRIIIAIALAIAPLSPLFAQAPEASLAALDAEQKEMVA